MSLKSSLNQIIKDRNGGIVSLAEIEAYCHQAHYKLSNAERRLRPSESPNIERLVKNGAIIGYRYLAPGPDPVDWFRSQPTIDRTKVGSIAGPYINQNTNQIR